MDRIKTHDNSHIEVVHEERKIRMFTDGDSHSEPDKDATLINSEFLNGIQEELCRFIESQGIELAADNYTGLERALEKYISDAVSARLEIYRTTINSIRDHVLDPLKPLPGIIPPADTKENPGGN